MPESIVSVSMRSKRQSEKRFKVMDKRDEVLLELIRRVNYLEQEVVKLGGETYKDSKLTGGVEVDAALANMSEVIREEAVAPKVVGTGVEIETPIATSQPVVEKRKPEKKKENVENRIGKNVMAILASVLIFFSLILFAGIAFEYLTDIAKVVIMFAISIGIAAFGIIKMPKKNSEGDTKYKTFYTTLAACGIGAIYITDLVGYFGFECIALIPFIISLVIWIVVTMYLAYRCSIIFVYISNLGLVIATLLTAIQFENSLLAFVLYTICLVALYVMNRADSFAGDSFYFIQYPIVFLIVSFAVETDMLSYAIFTVLLMAVLALANLAYNIESKHMAFNLVTAILNIVALIRICAGVDEYAFNYVIIVLLIAMMFMYFFRYHQNIPSLFHTTYVIAYLVSVALFVDTDMYVSIALVPYILFIAAGFFLKDSWLRMGGYFAMAVSYAIHMDFYESGAVFVFYFAIFLLAVMAVRFMCYSKLDKYVLTAVLVAMLVDMVQIFDFDICVSYAIFAVVAVLMNTKLYHIDYNTGETEKGSKNIGYIANAIMIAAGLSYLFDTSMTSEVYQVAVIALIALVLVCMNTTKLFELSLPEMPVGFYIGLKFSVWIYAILYRLEAASFVVSIVGILFAITCIVLGFVLKQKSFRLYGLIVSMISVVKLILFDISYDSNILRPVGFFIAGILCFAISFIYSKLEKSILTEEEA